MTSTLRNIPLAYLLTISRFSWFWFGIWIFFYLRFTNYAGIGLIETVLIVTMTTMEIPTGAIADLLGKKKSLIAAYLLQTVGAFIFAYAAHLNHILMGVFVMCLGGTLISGTLEALVYDSLKENNLEKRFDKIIANIQSLQLITPALLGALGGFMYQYDFRSPFVANAIFYALGMGITLFLIEPKLDSDTFSWSNYWRQTRQGFQQLFKTDQIKNQTFLLFSVAFVVEIIEEILTSFLGVEFGFKEVPLSILWSVTYILTAGVSQLTPRLLQLTSAFQATLIVGLILAVSLISSPWLGLISGGIALMVISATMALNHNLIAILINQSTESKHRATTISTFNMLKNIPYVFTAYFLGSLADQYTARNLALGLGIFLLGLLLWQGRRYFIPLVLKGNKIPLLSVIIALLYGRL